MKDLYTFDYDESLALATYHEVRDTYSKLFNELKIPYLVAEADSGDIGGNLSHEFHFPTPKGEDHIISCSACDYVANEELAESKILTEGHTVGPDDSSVAQLAGSNTFASMPKVWRGVSRDRLTLVNVWYPSNVTWSGLEEERDINIYAIKAVFPELDASIENPLSFWTDRRLRSAAEENPLTEEISSPRILNLIDGRLSSSLREVIESSDSDLPFWPASAGPMPSDISTSCVSRDPLSGSPLNLLRIKDGDACPRCSGRTLTVQKAIEIGHTFHLGTRYTEPLGAMITLPGKHPSRVSNSQFDNPEKGPPNPTIEVPMQMGCHGIGVSRMISAVAESLADDKGLNWPRVMAPYEVVIVPTAGLEDAAVEVYDALQAGQRHDRSDLDLVLDDRDRPFSWKMGDADLIGYPVIIVVGRKWGSEKVCEVQCRRLNTRDDIPLEQLSLVVNSLLDRL